MKALQVAYKDFQILIKDRGALINMFLLPIVFIIVLSSALQGIMGGDDDRLIELPVVNLDDGGHATETLLSALDEVGGIEVLEFEQGEAEAQLEAFEIAWVLTIPPGFSDDVSDGRQVTLLIESHPEANETDSESVQRTITGVARGLALQDQLIASLVQMGNMQGTAPSEYQVFTTERVVAQAQSQFERAQTDPLIVVEETAPANLGEQVKEPNSVQQFVPGLAIVFVFLTAASTAYSIYREKQTGSFRRLVVAPISKAGIMTGKMIPNFIVGLIQIVVIFAISILILPLIGLDPLTLGNEPLALALVAVVLVLCSTAMGLMIAAIARTEGQITGLSGLVLWTMAAIGGCLYPTYLQGGFLDTIGKVVPHYWAVQASQDLIVRGRGLVDVLPEVAILSGFALLFFAIGLWRFEFD
jgi:ABC-2 type transport system permease protein